MKKLVIAALYASFVIGHVSATETEPKYQTLVESINELLIENYVFPEVGSKYANRLNECLADNCFAEAESDKEIAIKLTDLLQSVHKDKHLNVFAPGQREEMRKRRMAKRKGVGKPVADATGIAEVKILDSNIGYFKIDLFPGTQESLSATREAMKKLKNTNAVVFDIRDHRGGVPENITEIANFLFQEETHMVTTRSPYVNNGKPTPHLTVPNKFAKYYQGKPIYLLTSKRSGSAAEHFAMSMKATGRAILVGETTGGYGHWGGIAQLENGFSLFVPSGRTYHPVNQLGWEGIGITPDIEVKSEDSLDYAVKRIRTLL